MSTDTLSHPFFRARASHHWLTPVPGERIASHVDGRQTGQKFSCAEAVIDPGFGPPLHVHTTMDELIYVLEGEVDFVVEERRFRSGPGDCVFIPQSTAHTFRNLGSQPARLLGVYSPCTMDGFFEALEGQPASAFPEIARRHGVEIVGPMIDSEPA